MTITQWHVPVDDENCYWYAIFTSYTAPVDKKKMRDQRLELYELPDYKSRKNKSNDYGFDPHEQATETYTGMGTDINVHDQWAVESMGAIQDRTNEHLGTSDKAIVQYRRLLRQEIEKVVGGEKPMHVPRRRPCAQHPGPGDHGRHRADARLGNLLDGSRRQTPPRRAVGGAGAERDRRQDPAFVGGGVMGFLMQHGHLAPLAGRGRILRVAKNPGEGVQVYRLTSTARREPLTPTLSPQVRGEGDNPQGATR